MMMKNKKALLISLALLACGVIAYTAMSYSKIEYSYKASSVGDVEQSAKPADVAAPITPAAPTLAPITHIPTPSVVKAAYMSSWVAGLAKYRDPVIKLVDDTELNAVVVDVKDSTGRIGFHVADADLAKLGSVEGRIPDVRALTTLLHSKHIYIIGRVAVFQDPFMAKAKPEWAITKKSDGGVWKDHKGLSFLDPANKNVWDYTVAIAHEAYADGFDEINFDYIRYPSDGDIKDINYHIAPGGTRADNLEAFFKYLRANVQKDAPIPMSADLFGLTTEVNDDMGIGQVWEKALPNFDFLSPMVYPSHYPPGTDGFKNPAEHPYEVISKAMAGAIKKTLAVPGQSIAKIRPWLQDFNLGAVYTKDLIQAEMKAVYDKNLTSWMLWDPNNKYTPSALKLETNH